MDRERYLQEVWARLSNRMPRKDLEGVIRYYEEYFDEAGPAREAEVMAELGTPEELAGRILEDRTAKGRRRGGAAVAAVLAVLLIGGMAAVWMYVPRQRTYYETDVPVSAVENGHIVDYGTAVWQVVEPEGMEPFTGLDIDAAYGSVYVVPGEVYSVEVDAGSWEVNGGTLVVRSKGTGAFVRAPQVTVCVPEGAWLDRVDIDADLGECHLGGFSVGDLTVDADCGSVSLYDITASSASVTADLGSVELSNVTAEELSVKLSSGELNGWELTVDRRLEASNAMGSIELSGDFRGETVLKCDMGSISLFCQGSEEEYSYDLEASLGAVRVDGYGSGRSLKKQGGANTITATSSMGEITLSFG